MIEYKVIPDTNIIEFVVDGAITKEELEVLIAACEALIEEHGKIRMLKQMKSLGLIEPSALWENLRFAFRHMKHVERVAGVADQTWMGKITKLANPFFSAEMRFFPTEQIEAARAWLREPAA